MPVDDACMRFDQDSNGAWGVHHGTLQQLPFIMCGDRSGKLLPSLVSPPASLLTTDVSSEDEALASANFSKPALNALIQSEMTKAKNITTSTQGVAEYGSLRGRLFENLAHDIIMEGGKFTTFIIILSQRSNFQSSC